MIPIGTLGLIAVTAILFYYFLSREKSKYPPGPVAFPLIGNLPQLLFYGSIPKFAQHYKKVYGDVFTFTFGSNRRVVISGYENFHQLLIKNGDITSSRVPGNLLSKRTQELVSKTPGLFWAPHPHWKTLRSFSLSSLREDGMGKAALEPQIIEEIGHYCSTYIEPTLNRPIELKHGISQATCNVISQLMYAKRFDYDDEKFNTMIEVINEAVLNGMKLAIASSLNIPGIDWLVRPITERDRYVNEEVLMPTLQSYIDEHKADLDRENPRDLTDRFLIHAADGGSGDSCYSEYNGCIYELHLYVAGTETTSTALRWALLLMCRNPEKMKRVQEEIDNIIGPDRHPTCKDRMSMPYTDAVLLETLRKSNLANTALPHTLDKEITVNGVSIPAGAELMLNMASVLHDETVFEEPDKFKPERYLTGDIALKKQRTIPFGLGRRVCLGESLARMEFFLFFTTFLQKYDIKLADGVTVTEEPVENLISAPRPYEIVFSRRGI